MKDVDNFPDIKVVSILYDTDTEILSLDFDEDELSNYEALGMLVMAIDIMKEIFSETDDDEDN